MPPKLAAEAPLVPASLRDYQSARYSPISNFARDVVAALLVDDFDTILIDDFDTILKSKTYRWTTKELEAMSFPNPDYLSDLSPHYVRGLFDQYFSQESQATFWRELDNWWGEIQSQRGTAISPLAQEKFFRFIRNSFTEMQADALTLKVNPLAAPVLNSMTTDPSALASFLAQDITAVLLGNLLPTDHQWHFPILQSLSKNITQPVPGLLRSLPNYITAILKNHLQSCIHHTNANFQNDFLDHLNKVIQYYIPHLPGDSTGEFVHQTFDLYSKQLNMSLSVPSAAPTYEARRTPEEPEETGVPSLDLGATLSAIIGKYMQPISDALCEVSGAEIQAGREPNKALTECVDAIRQTIAGELEQQAAEFAEFAKATDEMHRSAIAPQTVTMELQQKQQKTIEDLADLYVNYYKNWQCAKKIHGNNQYIHECALICSKAAQLLIGVSVTVDLSAFRSKVNEILVQWEDKKTANSVSRDAIPDYWEGIKKAGDSLLYVKALTASDAENPKNLGDALLEVSRYFSTQEHTSNTRKQMVDFIRLVTCIINTNSFDAFFKQYNSSKSAAPYQAPKIFALSSTKKQAELYVFARQEVLQMLQSSQAWEEFRGIVRNWMDSLSRHTAEHTSLTTTDILVSRLKEIMGEAGSDDAASAAPVAVTAEPAVVDDQSEAGAPSDRPVAEVHREEEVFGQGAKVIINRVGIGEAEAARRTIELQPLSQQSAEEALASRRIDGASPSGDSAPEFAGRQPTFFSRPLISTQDRVSASYNAGL